MTIIFRTMKESFNFATKPFFHHALFIFLLFCTTRICAQEVSVSFSSSGGFYDSPFELSLSCPHEFTIHYSLNGNSPTLSDPIYEVPLLLNEELYSKSNLYTIQDCPDEFWHVPNSIQRCIVIRAAAFDADGNQVSPIATHSFMIKSLGCDTHGLPIVSICIDSVSLFDHEIGIMSNGKSDESDSMNYLQKGRQWERICNVEFYELDNQGINQNAGLRLHGDASRASIQKGFRLYARKEYGKKRFHHKFFGPNELGSFKHLVLKPLRNGLVAEHICSQIAKPLNLDVPALRPTILFLNGEYWGFYYLKERADSQFIADHYYYEKEEINVIESWTGTITNGNNDSFLQMMRWFAQAKLSDEENYRHACSLIDIDCFIDYYCLELFVGNDDWPDFNMRCWQAKNGKWRWIFTDGDGCLYGYQDIFAKTIYSGSNSYEATLIFTKLLTNPEFRDRFYHRFGTLITNEFDYKTTTSHLENTYAMVSSGIDQHIQRFGTPVSKEEFDIHEYQYINTFFLYRALYASKMIYSLFYVNNWEFRESASASQSRFKFDPNQPKPRFLLRMARQFKDWKYVKLYYKYEYLRMKEKWKSSRLFKSFKRDLSR